MNFPKKVFSAHWDDNNGGSRFLKVELLTDEIIHFELFQSTGPNHLLARPDANKPIWVSPMIDKDGLNQFGKLKSFAWRDDGFETASLRITITEFCRYIKIHNKKHHIDLTTLRSYDLEKKPMTITIEHDHEANVYGVGNFFFEGNDADGDWSGREYINTTPGHYRGSFCEGSPSMSQFPMIYVLGPGVDPAPRNNYGLFFDQVSRVDWDFRNDETWSVHTSDGSFRWFVIAGDDLKEIKKRFATLVGRPPVPPRAVFGHWCSEFGYDNWKELHDDLDSLRSNQFPVDGFALDIQWFGLKFQVASWDKFKRKIGSLQFSTDGFPNPESTIRDLYQTHGIQLMTIEESYVDEWLDDFVALKDSNYRQHTDGFSQLADSSDNSNHLIQSNTNGDTALISEDSSRQSKPGEMCWWGRGGMIDWSNPAACRFWHALKRHYLARIGILCHWLDLGEPEMFFEKGHYHGLPGLPVNKHSAIHNMYNLLWAQGISNGYRNYSDSQGLKNDLTTFFGHQLEDHPRFFTMSRAGTVGSQRYGGMWSGDLFSNMENLRAHLGTQKDMALLGMDYYSTDVGGFFRKDRNQSPRTPNDHDGMEIVTQWVAVCSLLDIPFRTHAWALEEKENLRFALDQRGDIDSNRENIWRRYELIPYLYTLAHRAQRDGDPVFPPLVYNYQDDPTARNIGNVKMIGDALIFGIVATIDQTQRNMYLPRDLWYDYEDGTTYQGQGQYTNTMFDCWRAGRRTGKPRCFMAPLLARAGAIIPCAAVDGHTMNVHGKRSDGTPPRDELILKVFASSTPSDFKLIEDDGLTIRYLNGHVRETIIELESSPTRATVSIHPSTGTFQPGQSRNIIVELYAGKVSATQITVNGTPAVAGSTNTLPQTGCVFENRLNYIRIVTPRLSNDKSKIFVVDFTPC